MDELNHMSADPETRAEYDARVREMNRIYAGQTVKYKEGLEKGREEGKAEGLEEGEKIGAQKERAKAKAEKIESARKMLHDVLSVEVVSNYSGLSFEVVEKLS